MSQNRGIKKMWELAKQVQTTEVLNNKMF